MRFPVGRCLSSPAAPLPAAPLPAAPRPPCAPFKRDRATRIYKVRGLEWRSTCREMSISVTDSHVVLKNEHTHKTRNRCSSEHAASTEQTNQCMRTSKPASPRPTTLNAMQIARVRTPNRLNLVVYVQHSRGIISSDADLCTKRPRPSCRGSYWILVFARSNYRAASDAKLNFHQLLPYERALIKVKYRAFVLRARGFCFTSVIRPSCYLAQQTWIIRQSALSLECQVIHCVQVAINMEQKLIMFSDFLFIDLLINNFSDCHRWYSNY